MAKAPTHSTKPVRQSLAMAMIRDLRSVGGLARNLEEMAPYAVSAAGGGDTLVSLYGGPTGAGFWSLKAATEQLWSAIAFEHQQECRCGQPGLTV